MPSGAAECLVEPTTAAVLGLGGGRQVIRFHDDLIFNARDGAERVNDIAERSDRGRRT